MRESCCQFGSGRKLAGIVTEPEGCAARLGLVLVSAGLTPKFGPHRLYAGLARRLAKDGVVTLRFDLGGIGDSAPEYEHLPLRARTELEIRAALDHLNHGRALDGIVLGGLCSGAEDSFRNAALDPRVTGVVLIDPFAYRTSGFGWRHFMHRLGRRGLRALGLFVPLPGTKRLSPAGRAEPRLVSYKYMERAESTETLRVLLARNVRLHFLYTAGMREVFNHERQLRKLFSGLDFKGLVSVDHLPRIDHTQLLEEDRNTLIETVARRMGAPRLNASVRLPATVVDVDG